MGVTVEEWLDIGASGRVPRERMDYRDAERDGDDDSPLRDPESGEPKAPPAQAFYVGYTARMLEDEALRWMTVRGAFEWRLRSAG